MENIHKHFVFETGYDLQSILFANKLSAYHNRGTRRSTGVETVRRKINIQQQMDVFPKPKPQEVN